MDTSAVFSKNDIPGKERILSEKVVFKKFVALFDGFFVFRKVSRVGFI